MRHFDRSFGRYMHGLFKEHHLLFMFLFSHSLVPSACYGNGWIAPRLAIRVIYHRNKYIQP